MAYLKVALLNAIDRMPSLGLLGVSNSLAYRVHELAVHFHSQGRWLGKSADQSGNDWGADTLTPFQAISGNGVYGADANDEAKVIGSGDMPIITGNVKFDLHRLLIVDVSVDTVYKLRIVYGSGTMAAAITAGQYSETMIKFDSSNPQQSAGIPFDVQMPRISSSTCKVWIQAKCATDNATVDFFVGLHEYVG